MPGGLGKYVLAPKTLGDGEEQEFLLDVNGNLKVITTPNSTTSSAKLEDAPHVSSDVGSFVLGVRNDSNVSTTSNNQDYNQFSTSQSGQLIVKEFSAAEADWSYAPPVGGITNTTTAVTVKASAGAGLKNYISGIQIDSTALGVATEFAIRDGAAGTVIFRTSIPAAGYLTPVAISFESPLRGTAATLLEIVTLTASVTGNVYCNLQGYTGP